MFFLAAVRNWIGSEMNDVRGPQRDRFGALVSGEVTLKLDDDQ